MTFTIFHDLLNQHFVLQFTIPDEENNLLPSWLRTPPNDPDILTQLRYLTSVANYLTNITEEDLQMDLIGIGNIDEIDEDFEDDDSDDAADFPDENEPEATEDEDEEDDTNPDDETTDETDDAILDALDEIADEDDDEPDAKEPFDED